VAAAAPYFPESVWDESDRSIQEWAKAWDFRPSMTYTQFLNMRGVYARQAAMRQGYLPLQFILDNKATLIGGDTAFGMDLDRNPVDRAGHDEETDTYVPANLDDALDD